MSIDNKEIKIIFMGSANFSVPILKELIDNFTVVGLVTEKDRPIGRGQKVSILPTKVMALEHNIPVYQPETLKNNIDLLNELKKINADLVVVAAYGKILPTEFLNLTVNGCVNVHPSLLPKYRGASPIQSALLNSEKVTGCSIILMDEGMDSGDILVQNELLIDPAWGYVKLAQELSLLGASQVKEIVPLYIHGVLDLEIQDDEGATFCYKVEKEDGLLVWSRPVKKIIGQIKAFETWPGCYTFYNKKKLDIVEAIPAEIIIEKPQIGKVVKVGKRFFVSCGYGAIELIQVKYEGGNVLNIKDFANGHQSFAEAILG